MWTNLHAKMQHKMQHNSKSSQPIAMSGCQHNIMLFSFILRDYLADVSTGGDLVAAGWGLGG